MRRRSELEAAYAEACAQVYAYPLGDTRCSLWIGVRDALAFALAKRDAPWSGWMTRRPRGEEGDEVRLGVSVGKKVGGAVERNKVKRAMREAFWSLADRLPDGYDFVLVGRADVAGLIDREGTDALTESLTALLDEAGE